MSLRLAGSGVPPLLSGLVSLLLLSRVDSLDSCPDPDIPGPLWLPVESRTVDILLAINYVHALISHLRSTYLDDFHVFVALCVLTNINHVEQHSVFYRGGIHSHLAQ